jgi:putative transposase
MPFWQLYYHLVWATKDRAPLITGDVEDQVHHYLRQKALDLEAVVFAINGMPDHVHMVAAIPPKIAVAHFVGQIKAVSATKFNRSAGEALHLVWQGEYGAFSFDSKRLPNYIRYVERQEEHHATNSTIAILERLDGAGPQLLHEPTGLYLTEDEAWRREMDHLTNQPL